MLQRVQSRVLERVQPIYHSCATRLARAKIILGANVGLVLVALVTIPFIFRSAEMTRLGPGRPHYALILVLLFLQMLHAGAGIYASWQRKVMTTKCYLIALPFSAGIHIYILAMLFRTLCDCDAGYLQCLVVTDMSRGQVDLPMLDPASDQLKFHPAEDEVMREDVIVPSVQPKLQPVGGSESQEVGPAVQLRLPWLPSPPRGLEPDAVKSDQGDGGEDEDEDAGDDEKDKKRQRKKKQLQQRRCQCETRSCRRDRSKEDVENDGRLPWGRSWCWLRPISLKACKKLAKEERFHFYKAPRNGSTEFQYWSRDVCRSGSRKKESGIDGCTCSGVSMHHGNEAASKKDQEKAPRPRMGSECKKWDWKWKDTEKHWCFVGIDSTCPDKEFHVDLPALDDDETDSFEEFYQWRSAVVCQKDLRDAWEETCHVRVILFRILHIVTLIVFAPLTFIVVIFLTNRCSDPVEVEVQFHVEDVSSEEEWEAETVERPSGGKKKGRKGGRASTSSVEVELARRGSGKGEEA